MTSRFLHALHATHDLTPAEHAVLRQAGVRSPEDLHSLVECFPSAVQSLPRLPALARAVRTSLHPDYVSVHATDLHRAARPSYGARQPDGVAFAIGDPVAPAPDAAMPPPPPEAAGATPMIDLRRPGWPVRQQGDRGTCVAFGTAACLEHLLTPAGTAPIPLSPQFLYWGIKTASSDPHKDENSALIAFAREAIAAVGVCTEALWPYVGAPTVPPSGQTATDPSVAARADAAARGRDAATFVAKPANAAAPIRDLLRRNSRPVAASLTVFCDPRTPQGPSNWGTPSGWTFGRVLSPPAQSKSVAAHCVCITGFVPDPDEALGGYFIVRNTWGTEWAQAAPSPGQTHAPEPGYGEVAASYVDAYCWEYLQF